jgi:hypothetical protein
LYYLHTPHSIILILLYVDDILVAHNKQDSAVYEQIMQGLFDKYSMRQVDLTRNRFLGIRITQSLEHGYVFLDQEQYAREILVSFNMSEGRVFKVPSDGSYLPLFDSDQDVKFPYRSCLGSIRYLVSCTRPDLAISLNLLERHSQFPCPCDRCQSHPALLEGHVVRWSAVQEGPEN